ncbi:hypothetical protein ACI797_20035 [Geodermatophilus sp. SYSU D00691]
MTQGPQGGTRNEDQEQVSAAPEQSPRAAQGPMSGDVTRVPGDQDVEEGADAKAPGISDATGPTG